MKKEKINRWLCLSKGLCKRVLTTFILCVYILAGVLPYVSIVGAKSSGDAPSPSSIPVIETPLNTEPSLGTPPENTGMPNPEAKPPDKPSTPNKKPMWFKRPFTGSDSSMIYSLLAIPSLLGGAFIRYKRKK